MILNAPAQRVTPFFHSRVFEWHCIDLVGFHERVRISLGTVRVKLPLHQLIYRIVEGERRK